MGDAVIHSHVWQLVPAHGPGDPERLRCIDPECTCWMERASDGRIRTSAGLFTVADLQAIRREPTDRLLPLGKEF